MDKLVQMFVIPLNLQLESSASFELKKVPKVPAFRLATRVYALSLTPELVPKWIQHAHAIIVYTNS